MWHASSISVWYVALAAPTVARGVRHWIYHLGAIGFIPLGLLDGSVVPLPGSMDVLLIVLSARQHQLWPYYAVMATLGSVIGSFVTYRLARKGGREALTKRVKPKTLEKVESQVDRWGLGAIAIPALLPPPMPMVPFVLAAGAMQYPVKKFLFALTLGRSVRYTVLAFLAARYGRHVLRLIAGLAHPEALMILGLIAAVAAILFLVFRLKRRGERDGRPVSESSSSR